MTQQVAVNIMCIVFFDYRGLVHYDIVPRGHAVNQEFYLAV
jgi:Transposase.